MDTILNNQDYYDQIFEKVHLEANTNPERHLYGL